MKKLLPIILAIMILFSSCGAVASTVSTSAEATVTPIPMITVGPSASPSTTASPKPTLDPRSAMIHISSSVDTALSQVIIKVINNSNATFTGKIFVTITSGTTDLDAGYFTVSTLPSGQTTYNKIAVKTTDNLHVSADITQCTFS